MDRGLFVQVKGTRLYQQVVEQIMRLLREGYLQPGDHLPPERVLAEQLGVSRAVLREAFRVLESRGFVETRQGGGRVLRNVSLNEVLRAENVVVRLEKSVILDVLEARQILEVATARLAAQRATPEDIERLEQIHRMLDEDFEKYEAYDYGLQFHFTLAQATHNFMLRELVRFQTELLGDLKQKRILGRELWRNLNRDHGDILDAIKRRDPDRAAELMRLHLEKLREAIKAT